jgi:stress response protein SCP2
MQKLPNDDVFLEGLVNRSNSSDSPNEFSVPPPPQPQSFAKEPKNYALVDKDYAAWKKACEACKNNPDSLDPLRSLSNRPDLLSWRSPVSGQTLLHELAASGATASTLRGAVELGCEEALVNRRGETANTIAARKQGKVQSFEPSFRGRNRTMSSRRVTRELSPETQLTWGALAARSPPPMQQVQQPPQIPSMAATMQSSSTSCRKKGLSLARGEKAKIAKASINLDLDLNEEETYDRAELEQKIQQAYGASARVQIDEVSECSLRASRAGTGRWQNVKCRVMCDDASEAKQWVADGTARQKLASALNVTNTAAVEFGKEAQVDDVDAVTLKLDSDSASILCGACLLYNADDRCEKVVCYSDRFSAEGSVRHSGDTQVDGKSVHTISIVLSKVPDDISQLYFTLCSCGPADLSGFANPSIMLYQNSQPDANLLEYSINQAEKSASCVMARMLRQPVWTQGDAAVISRTLRKLRLPLLSIDLIMAMATESSWSLQALGTEEWNIAEKICSNYHYSKVLIEERLKTKTSASVGMVGFKRPSAAQV